MNDYDFDPLFRAVDGLAPELGEPVCQQIGRSTFVGKNTECFPYKKDAEMQELFDRADLLITHAGVGSILNGINRNIPMVVFPRSAIVGRSGGPDQQEYVARKVAGMGRAVVMESLDQLPEKIAEARNLHFPPYVKDRSLVTWLDALLSEIAGKKERHEKIENLKNRRCTWQRAYTTSQGTRGGTPTGRCSRN